MKLSPLEEPLERLDALNLGTLYHRILYKYFQKYFPGNWAGEFEEYKKGLEKAAVGVFSDYPRAESLPGGLWALYQEEILSNLEGIIRKDWEEGLLIPRFLELGFGLSSELEEEKSCNYPAELFIDTSEGPLAFRGKIDRIDLSGTGNKAIILDYKFGSRYGSYKKMLEGFNLQLPLYVMAVSRILPQITGEEVEVIGAGYYSISTTKKDGFWKAAAEDLVPVSSRSHSCLTQEDWDQTLKSFQVHLATYLNGILKGDFRVAPEDCSYCDFKDICRYDGRRIGGFDD